MMNIILVEDHLVVRNGIKLLLDTQDDIQVVAEADNGQEALKLLAENRSPDLLITDINMAGMDGLQLAQILHEKYPGIKVLILSMLNSIENVVDAFDKGVKGYLVKNVGYQELLFAIRHVADGGRYLSEELSMLLLDKFVNQPNRNKASQSLQRELDLTERELEVLQLISEGFTNLQIADRLFLSKRTVEGHRQHLIDKLDTKNSASLIKYAVKNGLVD